MLIVYRSEHWGNLRDSSTIRKASLFITGDWIVMFALVSIMFRCCLEKWNYFATKLRNPLWFKTIWILELNNLFTVKVTFDGPQYYISGLHYWLINIIVKVQAFWVRIKAIPHRKDSLLQAIEWVMFVLMLIDFSCYVENCRYKTSPENYCLSNDLNSSVK